jgi:hypothetical protein
MVPLAMDNTVSPLAPFENLSLMEFSTTTLLPLNFTLPSCNNETMAAWFSKSWNSPFIPGTVTEVTSPANNVASGDTISKYIFLVVGC